MKRYNTLNRRKQEITLMTLLANEATKESAKILAENGKPKAKDYADMESKLAELYFSQPDKLKIEKQLAEIHPHKNWLVRTLDLVPKAKQEEAEQVTKPAATPTEEEVKSQIREAVMETQAKFSGFNGSQTAPAQSIKTTSTMEIIGIMGVVGLIGLTFIIVSKNLRN